VHVGLSTGRLMQMPYRIRRKHSYGDLLGNDGLAVPPTELAVKPSIEAVVVAGRAGGEGAVSVRGCGVSALAPCFLSTL
jgi:hypothetical protein